jgi:hypothetical protein
MAVVMLSEGCNCGCQNNTFSTLVNKMKIGGPAGCMMSEETPFLSSRLGNWIRENVCPACHRTVDNVGDFFVNLTGGVEDLTATTFDATGQIVAGVGTGVGGFIADPKNIPCAIGIVGTAFGAPMGLGGCAPQGYNEQNQTFLEPKPSIFSNPLVLGGLGLVAVLLLTKKK